MLSPKALRINGLRRRPNGHSAHACTLVPRHSAGGCTYTLCPPAVAVEAARTGQSKSCCCARLHPFGSVYAELAQAVGLRAAGLTFAALVAGLSAVVLTLLAQAHSADAGARGRSVAHAGSTP